MGGGVSLEDNSAEFKISFNEAKLRGLEAIGLMAEKHAKEELTSSGAVDTGRLRNSITYAVTGSAPALTTYTADRADKAGKTASGSYSGVLPDETEPAVYIGTNVEYAPFIETGTCKMAARPYLRPAALNHTEEYKRILQDSLENA